MTLNRAAELSGMVGPDGEIGQPLPASALYVPDQIELEDDALIWPIDRWGARKIEPKPQMLDEFLGLASSSRETVAAYAQRWGILDLCIEHLLPRTHDAGCHRKRHTEALNGQMWEPLGSWRRFALEGRQILEISAQLQSGELGSDATWKALVLSYTGPNWAAAPWWKRSVEADGLMLAYVMNQWIDFANVRVSATWNLGRPDIRVGSGHLFGALATYLLLAAARTHGFAICSACGRPHMPRRRPASGRRNYCKDCRAAGAPERDAARDYRRKPSTTIRRKG